MAREVVKVPDLGGAESVDVIEINVVPGDRVEPEQSLLVLESDKATMEVPSPYSGKVSKLLVKEGASVSEGADLMELEVEEVTGIEAGQPEAESATGEQREQESAEKPGEEVKAVRQPETGGPKLEPMPSAVAVTPTTETPTEKGSVYAGPAARQLARQLGVSLSQVRGTGPKQRILKQDIQQYVKQVVAGTSPTPAGGGAIPPVPDIDLGKFGPVEEIPLSKIARLTATNMTRSWLNVPHVTQFDEADISEIEGFRQSLKARAEQRGVKLTLMPFLLMACARGLKANLALNRSWHSSGEKVIQKHYVHIGMAVDTPRGLVVPVIRDVDQKGLWQLAEEVGELAEKAREGTLTVQEMQGGCFSISSLGAIGGTGFTPIVNTPEVAILAVSKTAIKPQWEGEQFMPRKMLPLGLSYDHRIVNGADAGRFLTYVVEVLGNMRGLLL